ncbi:hypothetical protein J6590_045326 [Homalodisca vitripennis]|nr:hypothetical protein J6590_045326 [Homalodisca vitripennis]
MAFTGLLDCLQDVLVDAEADGALGHNADQGHVAEGQQDRHDAAEHDPRLLGVPPIHQRLHWNTQLLSV